MQESRGTIVFIDNSVSRLIRSFDTIRNHHFDLKIFNDADEGVHFLQSEPVDILFLNLDLVPQDAVSFTKELRRLPLASQPFIVIYSDKQDDFVQEMALNSGADAYIGFHEKPSILILFIKNLLRRKKKPVVKKGNGGIMVDAERFLIFKKDEAIQLPKKEFKVFELLFNSPDKFFSKEEIGGMIWGDAKIGSKRTIDVHIYNIRQQLGKRVIISQKGKGYRINNKLILPPN
jgi:DNA-binding response OmpR family regulator